MPSKQPEYLMDLIQGTEEWHRARLGILTVNVAQNYYQLVEMLISRRKAIGLPQLEVDHIAGFQDGYTGKIERPLTSYGRHTRWDTLATWLDALDVGLVIVPLSRPRLPNGRPVTRTPKKSCPHQLEFRF